MPEFEIVAETPVFLNDRDDLESAIEAAHTYVKKIYNEAGKDSFDIGVCVENCPNCGGENIRATQVGNTTLVGLQLSDTVFNAENKETAIEVFKSEIRDVQEVDIEIIYVSEVDAVNTEA